ncbi:hypothetical protein FGG08_001990 [Glutinoglossum americanum]|uniref:Uncharacterized protein n=1 Tax=Glutinoglossum americanum TaxID=1670608 RepID=A0A9P8L5W3_9PEZI|nr:hypothetical protein FGG08_001990 [Glutinoglossum americanum]
MRIHFLSPTFPLLLLSLLSSLPTIHTTPPPPSDPDEFEPSTLPNTLTLHLTALTPNPNTNPPTPYGTISYNPTTLQGRFTPSSPPLQTSSLPALAKLGLYDTDERRWRSAVVASKEALAEGGCVVLHLDAEGEEVRHVSFAEGGEKGGEEGACVRVLRTEEGPGVVLNSPVVVDENGKVPEPEVEKSFLQK